jgi:hypothetical protein
MKNSAFVLLFVVLAPMGGCFRTVIRAGGVLDPSGQHSQYANNYVMGLVPATFNVDKCVNGLAYVRSFKPWWSPIVSVLTIGLVSPSRIKYTCVAAPPPAAPVVVQMVAPPASLVTAK